MLAWFERLILENALELNASIGPCHGDVDQYPGWSSVLVFGTGGDGHGTAARHHCCRNAASGGQAAKQKSIEDVARQALHAGIDVARAGERPTPGHRAARKYPRTRPVI